jgi:GxxExxY protein
LEKRGLRTVRQQAVPIVYQGTRIEMGFRADLIVEDSVIVEIKSVEASHPCTRNSYAPICGWRTSAWDCSSTSTWR